MSPGSGEESERMDAETAVRTVKVIGDRAKLLRQARTRFHWSDVVFMVSGAVFFVCAAHALQDLEAYKAYDRQQLSPMHLLSPAIDFTIGFAFLIMAGVGALSRRVDALVRLLEESQKQRTASG